MTLKTTKFFIMLLFIAMVISIASADPHADHWSRTVEVTEITYPQYLGEYEPYQGGDPDLFPGRRAYNGLVAASTGEVILIGGLNYDPDAQNWKGGNPLNDVWISYDNAQNWEFRTTIPYSDLYPGYVSGYAGDQRAYTATIMTKNDTILVLKCGLKYSDDEQQSLTYRSTDLGLTWEVHENPIKESFIYNAKRFVTSDNQIWIMGGLHIYYEGGESYSSRSPARYVSYDDGITFEIAADSVNYLDEDHFNPLTANGVVMSDDSFIIAIAEGFTRRSYDYGYSWETYYVNTPLVDPQVNPDSPFMFKFNMTGGSLNVLPGDILALARPMDTPWDTIYFENSHDYWLADQNLYLSDDYGLNWYVVNIPTLQYGVPRNSQAAVLPDGSLLFGHNHAQNHLGDPDLSGLAAENMYIANYPEFIQYSIEWDRFRYYTSDTGVLTTYIESFDPDYIYNGVVYDDQGLRYHTYSISSLSQQEYVNLNYWEPGIYFASIEAIHRNTLERIYIETATMEVIDAVGFQGIVYDLITEDPIDVATVVITQQGFSQSYITHEDGHYILMDYMRDAPVTFSASATNYTHTPWSFTPLQAHLYEADLYMIPEGYFLNGTAIHGIVHDSYTYQAVKNANVNITVNGTEYYTTSNDLGYYYFEDLPEAGAYTLDAQKPRHQLSSPISGTLIQDDTIIRHIAMDKFHNLTIRYLDEKTRQSVGSGINVNLDDKDSAVTDSSGKVTFENVSVGVYWVDALQSDNYHSLRRLVAVEFDTTRTFYLTRLTDLPVLGKDYPPNAVQFEVRNRMGVAQENVTVRIEAIGTSLSAWDHLRLIFGWPVDDIPVEGGINELTTDSQGMATFMMIPVVQYLVQVESGGQILREFKVTPKDNYYLIVVGGAIFDSPSKDLDLITSSVTAYDTGGIVSVQYADAAEKTTQVSLNLYKRDETDRTQMELIETITIASTPNNFTHNFTITENYARQSYFVDIDAQHEELGDINRKYGVTFGGVRIPLGDIPQGLYIWISLGLLFLTGCIFGASSATGGAVIVCFMSWILWGMGWLDQLGINAPIAMGLASTVAILAVITKRFREEGHN